MLGGRINGGIPATLKGTGFGEGGGEVGAGSGGGVLGAIGTTLRHHDWVDVRGRFIQVYRRGVF